MNVKKFAATYIHTMVAKHVKNGHKTNNKTNNKTKQSTHRQKKQRQKKQREAGFYTSDISIMIYFSIN